MAKNAPITTIQSGIVTGILKAKSIPVTIALKSPTVVGLFNILFHNHSNKTHAKTLITVTTAALYPKTKTPASNAGIKAIITSSIVFLTVSLPDICGECETTSKLSKFIPSTFIYFFAVRHEA